MTEAPGEIDYRADDGTVVITISSPDRRNALSRRMVVELTEAFCSATDDDTVRTIILTGEGDKAFCAGADLRDLDMVREQGARFPVPMTGLHRNLHEVVLETYKPVICAVNGPAVAGGLELALACDIRLAVDAAFIQLPEAERGMGANFASVVLPRLIPRAIALEVLYTGRRMSAAEAAQWGLYNAIVPAAQLMGEAMEMARRIGGMAPLTLRRYKEMAVKTWAMSVPEALRLDPGPNPYTSNDREEGVRAFVERRPPRWTGY